MSKRVKVWLIIAACLIALGLIIFAAVMTVNRWDFTKLSTVEYKKNTYEISDGFSNISIKADTADVVFVPSDDGKCKVVCDEQKNVKYSVAVKDGTLVIENVDTRKWYDHIGIILGKSSITVYLPEAEYDALSIKASTSDIKIPKDFKFGGIDVSVSTGDVKCNASVSGVIKIKTSTGDIRVENVSVGALELAVSTGDVTVLNISCEGEVKVKVSSGDTNLTDISCISVTSNGNTGDISLKNVITTEKLSIERSTGDVKLEKCDASEILIKTDTGDVTGTLLSEKDFVAKSDTGDIDVPENVTGGRCEITTDTGDIRIKIKR